VLECQTNHSKFREGDYLFLHKSNPLLESGIAAILEMDEEHTLEVTPKDGNLAPLLDDRTGWIADEGFMDLSGYYLGALAEVADRESGRTRILPLILGDIGPQVDFAAYERGWTEASVAGLNDSQAEAVGQAYATDLVHLIQGPPGTGKTWVLAHLVQMLVAEGERVLVTASCSPIWQSATCGRLPSPAQRVNSPGWTRTGLSVRARQPGRSCCRRNR